MSTDLVIPQYTKDAQRRAANPRASAWVSANAGAGKTKVLTDRVVRLLLAGSLPGRILDPPAVWPIPTTTACPTPGRISLVSTQ